MLISLDEFVKNKPDLKFLFFGGKGGVGKTIGAAGVAYYFSEILGKRTLLASLNPVHSLCSLFRQDLAGGDLVQLEGPANLYCCEVEIQDQVNKFKKEIKQKITQFLKYADIPIKTSDFVDIATTNPAFEESAQFNKMIDMMIELGESGKYDILVFDCAAVANAIRLIGLSKIYGLWLNRMIKSREEALSLRVKLSFRKEKIMQEIAKDPLMADLMKTKETMDKARVLLRDPEKTAFFFVTTPLALPISVVTRFISMVREFDIPVGGVLVNMIIPEDAVSGHVSEYLKNKYEEQQDYLSQIEMNLGDLVRGTIPLFESEIQGVMDISKVAEALAVEPKLHGL
ncbi:MAG: ArsA family ATPase [Candidatus Hodarchaeota archaeon]